MIIYQDTKSGFLSDIAENHFQARIESAFFHKTGSVPSDSLGWASDYSRFADVLRPAQVADDIQVAIEYHCSPVGRSRIDVLLAGSDGQNDNGLIIELKAWDTADSSDIENMVLSPIGGGTVKLHPSAYLFNLYRRDPEPLEDARYQDLLSESRLFLANDVPPFKAYLERLVPRKAKNDILFVVEGIKTPLVFARSSETTAPRA